MDFTKHVQNRKATPQTEKVQGVKKQKRNNAGGISFKIDKWDYMLRFLILGTEGGTFYVSEKKLTRKACDNVQKCIDSDGKRAVELIVSVSTDGRAANNDAAIFALAMAASCGDTETRKLALSHINSVCRIGTHLFHFVAFVRTMRGMGRSLRDAITRWYVTKPIDKLAYQMLKYQGRDGWTHRDVLRLIRPVPLSKDQSKLFSYAVGKRESIPRVSEYATGMRRIRKTDKPAKAAQLVRNFNLTREAVPTEFLKNKEVQIALLEGSPMGALIRNLGNHAALDLHKPTSATLDLTVDKLSDETAIKRSRLHPLSIFNALIMYTNGCGFRGKNQWEVSAPVVEALENAFYKSFNFVEPTGKRIMNALDVSGSMTSKFNGGMMSCRVASAVLSMTILRTEHKSFTVGFSGSGREGLDFSSRSSSGYGWRDQVSELPLSKNQRLDDVVHRITNLNFGNTNCALPMMYAAQRELDVDAFVIYTDNETYVGDVHPWQALESYEKLVGHECKLIVVGMTSTRFSIARPDYGNMLDIVGFDMNCPAAISEFIK